MSRSKNIAASEVAPAPVTLPSPIGAVDGDLDQAANPEPTEATASPDDAANAATTAGAKHQGGLAPSRAGSVWIGSVAAAIVVVALIVFIAQNSQKVTIHFVGLHGHFSLALALLVAAVGGILLVAIPGSVRILQLRRVVKKQQTNR